MLLHECEPGPSGGDAVEFFTIDALRQIELDLTPLRLAVAGEAVSAERERERGKPGVVRIVGETIDGIGQSLRQAPGEKRILGVVRAFESEQDGA